MCLRIVDEDTKLTKGGIGYKVFRRRGRHLAGMFHGREKTYALGTEYVAPEEEHTSSIGGSIYPLGFHIYLTKADALVFQRVHEGGGVWRVRYSGVVASGLDHCRDLPAIVARRMTILRKVA